MSCVMPRSQFCDIILASCKTCTILSVIECFVPVHWQLLNMDRFYCTDATVSLAVYTAIPAWSTFRARLCPGADRMNMHTVLAE